MLGVFISHNHEDKTFVRRFGSDLAAVGVRPWIDEAEIRVGESLITKISAAIDRMDYFAVVLSPRSVASAWVRQELEQALTRQLAETKIHVLPILLERCDIPPFLRGKKYADFTSKSIGYETGFANVLKALGIDAGKGGMLFDPFAEEYGRHRHLYSRPIIWFCIFCGWKCNESFNDYICKSCKSIRPFAGGSATMFICRRCKQKSLAVARFCEWCGERMGSNDSMDQFQ
jgi:TIR domain